MQPPHPEALRRDGLQGTDRSPTRHVSGIEEGRGDEGVEMAVYKQPSFAAGCLLQSWLLCNMATVTTLPKNTRTCFICFTPGPNRFPGRSYACYLTLAYRASR